MCEFQEISLMEAFLKEYYNPNGWFLGKTFYKCGTQEDPDIRIIKPSEQLYFFEDPFYPFRALIEEYKEDNNCPINLELIIIMAKDYLMRKDNYNEQQIKQNIK